MKKLINLICLIFVYISITSCGSSTDSSSETAEENTVTETSCLADLIDGNEIEKMITTEQLAGIVGVPVEEIEFKDEKSKYAKYSMVGINWEPETPRTWTMKTEVPSGPDGEKTMMENTMEVKHKVFFGNVELIESNSNGPKEYFRFTYGPKTKKEKEAIKKSVDRSKESSDKVDEKSAETIKSMVDKQNSNEIKGLGDLAYWSATSYGNFYNESGEVETEAKIRVLHGDTQFSVVANVSDDIQEDLELAKKVAKQIVANCN